MSTDHPADPWAERYDELRRGAGLLRAVDMVASQGEVCGRCKTGNRTEITTRRSPLPGRTLKQEVCANCWGHLVSHFGLRGAMSRIQDARWLRDESGSYDVIKGLHMTIYPRRGSFEYPMARRADEWLLLDRVFRPCPPRLDPQRWWFGLEAWMLYLWSLVGTYENVTERGADWLPELGPWSVKRVRNGIALSRQEILQRIHRLTTKDRVKIRLLT